MSREQERFKIRVKARSKFMPPGYKEMVKKKPSYGLYSSRRWHKLRSVQLKSEPWCAICESRDGIHVPATVVDHITPHRGDMDLFYDTCNLQSLCKPCHDLKTGKRM